MKTLVSNNMFKPEESRLLRQTAALLAISALIAAFIYGAVGWRDGVWQFMVASTSLTFSAVFNFNVLRLSYTRPLPFVARRLIANILFFLFIGSIMISDLWWVRVGLVFVLTTTIALRELPPQEANWYVVGATLVGLTITLIDALDWGNRPALINESQTLIWALSVVLLLFYTYLTLQKFSHYNLQTKVIVVALFVSLIPLWSVGAINEQVLMASLSERAKGLLTASVTQVTTHLDAFFEDNMRGLAAEAKLPVLVSYLEAAAVGRPDGVQAAEVQATLQALLQKDPAHIVSYALLDTRGEILLSTEDGLRGRSGQEVTYIQEALQDRKLHVSKVIYDEEADKEAYFHLVAPVDDNAGRLLGLLRVTYDTSILQQIIVEHNGALGLGSYAILLDENQIRLAHGTEPEIKASAQILPMAVTNLLAPFEMKRATNDQRSMVFASNIILDEHDIEYFAVVSQLRTHPWLVIYAQPEDLFAQPVEAQSRTMLLVGVVLALGVLALAVYLSHKLAHPVLHLTAVADQIAQGDLTARAAVSSRDEIGSLATTFNAMAGQLGQLFHNLAEEVTAHQIARQNLQDSEENYRLLVENSLQSILIFQEGQIMFANPAAVNLLGYTTDELYAFDSKQILSMFHPEDRSLVQERRQDALEEANGRRTEYRIVRADGTVRWVEVLPGSIVFNKKPALLSAAIDITERRQSEEQQIVLFKMLRALSQTLDFDEVIQTGLEMIGRLAPWPRYGLVIVDESGQNLVYKGGHGRYLDPAYHVMPISKGIIGRAARTGQTQCVGDVSLDPDYVLGMQDTRSALSVPLIHGKQVLGVLHLEHEHLNAFSQQDIVLAEPLADVMALAMHNARLYDQLEQRVQARTADLLAANGQLEQEIQEHEATESRLRASEERLRMALGAGELGLWDWNIVEDQIAWSEKIEQILMIPIQSFDGKPETMLSYIHPEDRQDFLWNLQRALKQQGEPTASYRIIGSDGTWRWIEGTGKAVYDLETGKAVRMVGTARDVTFQREAEAKIKTSLAEKEILLKEIHHRVKNNLQVVSSLLDLQSYYVDDEGSQEMLRESQRRIRTMALIHEKLYSSADLARVNVAEYFEDLISYLWQSFGNKKEVVHLRTDIAPVLINVETAVPYGLILNELVSNVIKHAFPEDRSGELVVTLQPDEAKEYLTLTVADNGVGFPAGFDWRRGPSLGLTIVQTLVQQLRGKVALETAVGTTFKITCKWRKIV